MTEEEKLRDSLATWVPPWQRAGSPARVEQSPDAPPVPEAAPVSEALPEPDVPGEPDAALEPEVSIETHRMGAGDQPAEGGGEDGDGHDDDYGDVQQPETDSLESPSAPAAEPGLDVAVDALAEPPTEPPGRRPADLGAALEAILLVVDEPISAELLGGVLEAPAAEVEERLRVLADEYDQARRGFQLRRAAGGWRLYTRGDYAAYVERFILDGQSTRLTQAALETLAVVAYQQPVTRSRMAAIRGVNCDGVVRTLMSRGLIEECGTQPESGAYLYRTTQLFLEKLGLDSLEELPSLAPFLPDDVNGLVDAER